jgi:hypothetical protein
MASSWSVYYLIFLSGVLSLALPALLSLASRWVAPPERPEPSVATRPALTSEGGFNTRFLIGANVTVSLMGFLLLLIPLVGSYGNLARERLLIAVACLLSVVAFSGVALLYASVKGDLGWIKSVESPEVAPEANDA